MKTRFTLSVLSLSVMVSFGAAANDYASIDTYEGKAASKFTENANTTVAKSLPWEDTSAFKRTTRGLIAEFGTHEAGELKNRFEYMADMSVDDLPPSVNPSIWRQGM
ncbi:MAG: alkyl/aryl-sulfatase, partial [Aliivibrio sp.]|nr:alkyl/aryl-sulfatase [Aliivibrio sp.]